MMTRLFYKQMHPFARENFDLHPFQYYYLVTSYIITGKLGKTASGAKLVSWAKSVS